MNIIRGIGIVLGAVVGYLLIRKAGTTKEVEIDISVDDDRFVSTTRPAKLKVRERDSPLWHISEPVGGIGDAAVELRFSNENSPLYRRRPKDNRKPGQRKIRDVVRPGTKRPESYCYEVWYVSATTEYRMEDPELQVEAN